MNTRSFILALAACLLLGLTACTTTTPSFADGAHKSIHSSVLVVNEFLTYEYAHRATLDPKVTAVADALRQNMPPLVRAARAALATYESATDPAVKAAAKARLDTALADLARVQQQAAAQHANAKAARP